ncbi:ADM_collapsed_G0036010.mRNA.1.CDS.1 [Saccharomyces cerevisiae]|nr:ADM_collapsed_G0036010.mRNA.1.CDS.1 [Saccharomyces cerevisiae]
MLDPMEKFERNESVINYQHSNTNSNPLFFQGYFEKKMKANVMSKVSGRQVNLTSGPCQIYHLIHRIL